MKLSRGPKRRSPVEVVERATQAHDVPAERQHLSPAELLRFFRFFPQRSFWYPYFYVQYVYGCSLTETALTLDKSVCVHKPGVEGTIVVRRFQRENEGFVEQTCGCDARVLSCVDIARAWKLKRDAEDNPFLFASSVRADGEVGAERLSQIRTVDGWQAVSRFTTHRAWRRASLEAKFPEHLRHSHALRHTRAVVLLACGVPHAAVSSMLAHSSPRATDRFAQAAEEVARDARGLAALRAAGLAP